MDKSGQLHAPVVLLPGKQTPISMGQVAWSAPEPVVTLYKWEKSLVPTRNGTPVQIQIVGPSPVRDKSHCET
jgi:hypothetical protein